MATALLRYQNAGPSGPVIEPAPRQSGIASVLRSYRRHLWLFLLVAGTVLAAVAVYTLLQVPRYTATATLVIAPRPAEIGSDRGTPLSDPAADSSVDTQVELLKSRSLAGTVVDRLRLTEPGRFDALIAEPSWRDRVPFLDRNAPRPTPSGARREAAVERLAQGLDVSRTAQTFALGVSFTHHDRTLAAAVVNAFADGFVNQSLEVKREGASTANALLSRQLARARAEVEAAESTLGRYRVANNLMSVQGSTIAEQQLSSLQEQAALARAGEAEAAARLGTARRQLSRGSNGDDLGEALGSPVIQQLRSQRAELSGRVADLSSRYGPRYPQLAAAERQLADIDGQIQGEINRTVSNLEAQRDVASRRTASLEGSVSGARGAVAGNNIASVPLGGLQLRADTAKANYTQLLNRVNELGAQVATTQSDARVASLAAVPLHPTSPNTPINIIVGALLAVAAGLGAVFLRQGTDRGVRTLEDVEGRLRLPYLAGLPTLNSAVRHLNGSDPIAALVDHRESAYAEGYRSLAASVLEASGSGEIKTIALTSALPNEGKTTASIGLARIVAMSGKRVLLVDADLRRPSVAGALGLSPTLGLHQVLDGEAELDDALIRDEESGADILPALRSGKSASSAFTNPAFDLLLLELKRRYDVVILDASPVLPVVDGRLVAKKADATVLLVRWRKTPDEAVEMATHLLQSLGVTPKGVALTRVDLHALARTGYGDPAQFMGSYGGYYQN